MPNALFFGAFAARPRPLATEILRPSVDGDGDGARLRELLASKPAAELTASEIQTEVEGRLWMLAPTAFLYFLPAFLDAALESYESISIFTSELVTALTEPSRADIEEALDRAAQAPPGLGLPDDTARLLRDQQLSWFDAGTPTAIFEARVDGVTPGEGAAILAFFEALRAAHGADFPFRELEIAVERVWARYRR